MVDWEKREREIKIGQAINLAWEFGLKKFDTKSLPEFIEGVKVIIPSVKEFIDQTQASYATATTEAATVFTPQDKVHHSKNKPDAHPSPNDEHDKNYQPQTEQINKIPEL